MAYDVEFYQKENGEIPLLDFLESLPPKLRAKLFGKLNCSRNMGQTLGNLTLKQLKELIIEVYLSSESRFQLISPEYYIFHIPVQHLSYSMAS